MKTWAGHIRKLLQSSGAKQTAGGAVGSAALGLGAPIAYESFGFGEMPAPARLALGVLGGAAGRGSLGPSAAKLVGTRYLPAAFGVSDFSHRQLQGYSRFNATSLKDQAHKIVGEELHTAADKYLPQSALPDGTTQRTLSPEGRAAVERLLGNPELSAGAKAVVASPQVKKTLDGMGFQYSSLHGLAGTGGSAKDRATAYLQGRDRYRVPVLG